jgi:UDP-2,3-diacylglucosamine pyrophosphatase LpxH
MSEKILFEGMELDRKKIEKVIRRGRALFYQYGNRREFLIGYKDIRDAEFARRYLLRKIKNNE